MWEIDPYVTDNWKLIITKSKLRFLLGAVQNGFFIITWWVQGISVSKLTNFVKFIILPKLKKVSLIHYLMTILRQLKFVKYFLLKKLTIPNVNIYIHVKTFRVDNMMVSWSFWFKNGAYEPYYITERNHFSFCLR